MSLRNEKPLAGLNVVDCVSGPLGTIGRTLAELGADVVLIEPKSGNNARPDPGDVRGKIRFATANVGKKSVAIDLSTDADRAKLDAMLARADILIDDASFRSGTTLDVEAIAQAYPSLTVLSVSEG
jgi:crotonobetainyl-CoA:carnitine CoA-transferase CaiB-like acyl-CoA transferase